MWCVCVGCNTSESVMWCVCVSAVTPTSEQVGAGFPQFERLHVQLASAAAGVGHQPLPHQLDPLLAVGVEEDDDGVPLGVVQGVHRLRSHVQQRVLVLKVVMDRERTGYDRGWRGDRSPLCV